MLNETDRECETERVRGSWRDKQNKHITEQIREHFTFRIVFYTNKFMNNKS